ncbi:MAG: hypothetical protein HQL22_06565 [Candidatus Omnitrophica bacterium]|nr:hypothetical protein [Candidatus Omnitrophota bacterium]
MESDRVLAAGKPLKSKSTLFFERYARAENENIHMRLGICLLAGLFIIVLVAFVFSSTRPRAVYYIPGAVASGLAYPNVVPPASIKSFAVSWLMGWMNYTPDTVEGVYARSSKFMAPALLSQVHARSAEELEKVRRDRLSSVFMPTADPRLEEDKGMYRVMIEGKRGIYMGKEEMSFEAVRYQVCLLTTAATEDDPYALAVSDIKKEEVVNAAQ